MKSTIIDIKDITDSSEVYDSKPNRFMVYTIYVILAVLAAAFLWMCFFSIDIVVKSNGIFKGNDTSNVISSAVAGKVKETKVKNGQYVNEGDTLYTVEVSSLSDTLKSYGESVESSKKRLEILDAYEKSLDGNKDELDKYSDNPYYGEFVNRRELLFANISMNETDVNGQASVYNGNISSTSEMIDEYNEKVNKLNEVKKSITNKNNTLSPSDEYYYGMVESYLASYSYTELQYNNKVSDYQSQIDSYNRQLKQLNGNETGDEIESQINSLERAKNSAEKEKSEALYNLELQQTSSVEQQIESYKNNILSMESSLNADKLQLDNLNKANGNTKKNAAILTEKNNIASERLSYSDKLAEGERYLKNYEIQNDNCTVKAGASGYYTIDNEIKEGSFIQEGTSLGEVYPASEAGFYAELYVENSDIAKLKEGQEVNFEIAALPSSEYGYFTGKVEYISKDITVDQNSGNAYYLVKVKCDTSSLKNKSGDEISLINGMACQGKIIVDKQNVLTYLMKNLDLWG